MSRMYTDRAELYDLIYHWKDYRKEADTLRSLLHAEGIPDGSRVLEVACGTGAYLLPLSEHFRVAGCDLNEGMINVARRKLPGVPLWTVDMRELAVDEPYDAVLCMFSSIGYLLDEASLRRAAAAFARATRPGGLVVIEPWIDASIYTVGRPNLQTYDGPDLKLARATLSGREGDVAVMPMYWTVVPRGGPVEQFVDEHRLWFCPNEVMRRAFHDAGVAIEQLEGGLGRGLWVGRRVA